MKKFLVSLCMLLSMAAHSSDLYVVTTSSPGGTPDTLARQLSREYDLMYGGVTNVLNLPGADGKIGTKQFLKNTPDKHGVLFPASGHMISIDTDDYQQLVPIVEVVRQPWVLAVRTNFPANTWQEFVNYARVRPGAVSVAITSKGSTLPVASRIEKNHNLKFNFIFYSQNAAPYTDLYAGTVDAYWVPASAYFGTVMHTRSRAILVTGKKGISGIPEHLLLGDDKNVGEWYLSQGIFVNKSMDEQQKQLLQSRYYQIVHSSWGKEFQSKTPGVILGDKNTAHLSRQIETYRVTWETLKKEYAE